jgi:hypothetical protein
VETCVREDHPVIMVMRPAPEQVELSVSVDVFPVSFLRRFPLQTFRALAPNSQPRRSYPHLLMTKDVWLIEGLHTSTSSPL